MAMGVCTLVAAATAEVLSPNAPHGAPVASVGGCDSVLNALVRRPGAAHAPNRAVSTGASAEGAQGPVLSLSPPRPQIRNASLNVNVS